MIFPSEHVNLPSKSILRPSKGDDSQSEVLVPNFLSVQEAIDGRCSVRDFLPAPVEAPFIRSLLRAACRAPTAVHEEPWAFVVVQDETVLLRLSNRAKENMTEMEKSMHVPGRHLLPNFVPPDNIFYNASTLIAVYGKPMGPFVAADCWLATENILLTARGLGLGTCVIGFAVPALNLPEWKREFGVPDDYTAYAPVIVGMPRGQPPRTPRNEPEILYWQ